MAQGGALTSHKTRSARTHQKHVHKHLPRWTTYNHPPASMRAEMPRRSSGRPTLAAAAAACPQ